MGIKILLLVSFFFTVSCNIYKSPDRREFEADYSSVNLDSLQKISCSTASLTKSEKHSVLIATFSSEATHGIISEYKVDQNVHNSLFEVQNTDGTYCQYAQP